MDRIDKKLAKLGFNKVNETKRDVCYERYDEELKYMHKVAIYHKTTGKHIILSYTENTNSMYDTSVGLTYEEMKLFMAKFRKMKKKYKWK